MLTLTLINTFVGMLRKHDFWFSYSDDHSVFKRGAAELKAIEAMLSQYPKLQDTYSTYVAKMTTSGDKQVALENHVNAIEKLMEDEGITV